MYLECSKCVSDNYILRIFWRTYLSKSFLPTTLNEYTPTIFSFFGGGGGGGGGGAQASRLLLGAPNLTLAPLENFEPPRH